MDDIRLGTEWLDSDDIVNLVNEMFDNAKEKIKELEKTISELEDEKYDFEKEIKELNEKIEELEGDN